MLFIITLFVVGLMLQYDFWWGQAGFLTTQALSEQVAIQQKYIQQLKKRNQAGYAEVLSLRHDDTLLEAMARENLALIKPGEQFYQFIPTPIKKCPSLGNEKNSDCSR